MAIRDNELAFASLLDAHAIALERGAVLDTTPPPVRGPDLPDRVEGMLLGLAIGDALGNTSESLAPAARHAAFGEIRDYLANPYAGGRCVGLPSDDTQLAFWTVRRLLEDGGLIPERLAREFASHRIFGVGATVREFLRRFKDEGSSWREAGVASAGNGALMRIAPVLLPHLQTPSPALWADAALAGMVTHNDRGSNAACVAFVHLLWQALASVARAVEPEFWLCNSVGVMKDLEGSTAYASRSPHIRYVGSIAAFAEEEVTAAVQAGRTCREACDRWYSGAYLLETVPSVLYILCRHGDDPEEAIVRAVNDTRDNDTSAAIVGAAVGALHGQRALPRRWVEGLLGRCDGDDDGAIFKLIAKVTGHFVHAR